MAPGICIIGKARPAPERAGTMRDPIEVVLPHRNI